VTAIMVDDRPSDSYFQSSAYRILPPDADPDAAPPGGGIALSSLPLNCEFLSHSDGDRVRDGPLTVGGYALAGDQRGIARVDVSLDDGCTRSQADLEPEGSRWAWRHWSFALCSWNRPLRVTARAFDDTVATQPETAAALGNPKGYANNSWARLSLDVSRSLLRNLSGTVKCGFAHRWQGPEMFGDRIVTTPLRCPRAYSQCPSLAQLLPNGGQHSTVTAARNTIREVQSLRLHHDPTCMRRRKARTVCQGQGDQVADAISCAESRQFLPRAKSLRLNRNFVTIHAIGVVGAVCLDSVWIGVSRSARTVCS
jgi:hypothetical protein